MQNKTLFTFLLSIFVGTPLFWVPNNQLLHSQENLTPSSSIPLRLTCDEGPFFCNSSWVVRVWVPAYDKPRKLNFSGPKEISVSYNSEIAASPLSQIILVKMKAGPMIPANNYVLQAQIESEGQNLGSEAISVTIKSTPRLVISLNKGPEFLSENQRVKLDVLLKNLGNTRLEVEPHALLTGIEVAKPFTLVSLEPGEGKLVPVEFTPISQGSNIYTLAVGWKNRLSEDVFFEAFRFRLYRSQITPEKTFSIPSTARLFYSSEKFKSDSGYQLKGSGSYNEHHSNRIDYEVVIPTHYKLEDPSNATSGYITWSTPKFIAQAGDQNYSVGSFIENTNRGRGLAAKTIVGPVELSGYFQRKWNYQQNVADPSKARRQGYQTTYKNQWSKVSLSYLNRKDISLSSTPIHQLAVDTNFFNPGVWQAALNWGYQKKGTPTLISNASGLSKHPQAVKSQLDLLKIPKLHLGFTFSQADTGFNSGYSDNRTSSLNLSNKNSSRVNWNLSTNRSRTNLKRFSNQDCPLIDNIYQSSSGFINREWQWRSSINYTHKRDMMLRRPTDGVTILGQMGLVWQFSKSASINYTQLVNYYSFKESQVRFFPVTGERYTFNWFPLSWLSQSFFLENSKMASERGKTPNKSLGYSIYTRFPKATLGVSYQASFASQIKNKITSINLAMELSPLWSLRFSLDSRSTYDHNNDYRWNLSLERKFDLLVAQKRDPGIISGQISSLSPATLPKDPIVSVSGVHVKAKNNTYKLEGIPPGSHPVYLTNAEDNTVETHRPPTIVEITKSEPKKTCNIEVVAASEISGDLLALAIDDTTAMQDSKTQTSHWTTQKLANISVVATHQDDGQVVKVKSDSEGHFRLSKLRPGKWKLSVELDAKWIKEHRLEIQPFTSDFELIPGSREKVTIELKEKAKKWKTL